MKIKEAAIIAAYTGFLIGEFSDMHEYIEEIMGGPVFTHQLGDKKYAEKIRAAAKNDFVSIEIAEAGTVANETGFTPSQLLEQRDALLVLCNATVYCNSSKAGGCKQCPLYDRCAKEHGLIKICEAAIASTK